MRQQLILRLTALCLGLIVWAAALPAGAAAGFEHWVVRGESLYTISQRYGTSPWALQEYNGIGAAIRPGQRLLIPGGRLVHRVQWGDSLYLLAGRYGTSVTALRQVNSLAGSEIRPGQVLVIPNGPRVHRVQSGESLYTIARAHATTAAAIRRQNGLGSDRIYVGQWLGLPVAAGSAVGSGPGAGGLRLSAADRELLARLISAEAAGEPYEGQVAVGAVVLNRVRSPLFPNTLTAVVYQRWQFEPVSIGTIYEPATAAAERAAAAAAAGWDPTGGALYFFNPAKTTNAFLWSRPHAITIGGHRFAF